MNQPVPYHCKLCKSPHVAYWDDTCPKIRLEAWVALLTCDSCYDYITNKKRLREAIGAVCWYVHSVRMQGKQLTQNETNVVGDKLEKLTKAYADLLCRRVRLETEWKPDFVDQLIDAPSKVQTILQAYHDELRRIKRGLQSGVTHTTT